MKPLNIEKLLQVGILLSKEKNIDKLLEIIMEAAMDITNCDAGTLYICNENELDFKVMITRSQNVFKGGTKDSINLPPVPLEKQNVCAYCALTRQTVNIPDVYSNGVYDFSGPRDYDAITGYKTSSMLVVPMEDDYGEVIGVIQLINALDEETGEIISFSEMYEPAMLSLASQMAICIVNTNYSVEIKAMLNSFVQCISAAVDARTPYNANHTKHMAAYAERFIGWLFITNKKHPFKNLRKEAFLMSVWLHDVGKMVIPLSVMDKSTRLDKKLKDIIHRFESIEYITEISYLKGEINKEQFIEIKEYLDVSLNFIHNVNINGVFDERLEEFLKEISKKTYIDRDGQVKNWLLEDEFEALMIKKGTLTQKERLIMQSHVAMTATMMNKIEFPKNYRFVPDWASKHHELLNGNGYPNHLKGDQISNEVRLLTIIDVYDALTAKRPYKTGMKPKDAFDILRLMAKEGEIDLSILELFIESNAWDVSMK